MPDFKFSLLSVSKLTRELSCSVCFFLDFCVFQGLYDGKVLGIGKEKEGLYILKNQIQSSVQAMATSNMSEDATLWHLRLGHASTGILQHIQSLKHFSDKNVQHKCEICPLAKQCRLQFPVSESKTLKAFEMIHLDVWGPYKKPTFDKKQYFVTFVDDYSRFSWITL